jgi:cyclic pyranopterin phosphate synthase
VRAIESAGRRTTLVHVPPTSHPRPRLPVLGESRRALSEALPAAPPEWIVPREIVDGDGRAIRYLRLSISDRCDMACTYCMPPGGEGEHGLREELLSFEEIARLVRVLAAHGVRRVRLTGGEPLVRRDAVGLVAMIRDAGIDDVWMTTNGSRLAVLAAPLREAGLAGVNVSIDSLDPARFARITRGGSLAGVLAGARGCAGGRGSRSARTRWCCGARTSRSSRRSCAGPGRSARRRASSSSCRSERARSFRWASVWVPTRCARSSRRWGSGATRPRTRGRGPARYLGREGAPAERVGFITAVSEEFCASCNRVRLTSQGEVRACLASRRAVSLRDLLRAGVGDRELVWALSWALAGKAPGHSFFEPGRAPRAPGDADHARVGMSLIGG